MSALLLEPIGGISGDLFLGAAAALGVELQPLTQLLNGLGLDGFRIAVEPASQHGIHGQRVTVELEAEAGEGGQEAGHVHRPWVEIRQFLERLPGPVQVRALAIFGGLARAEAKIHGVPEDEVEFHEVGAVDSIVDIVGAAWALDQLGVERVFTRPPPLGSGLTHSQHGVIPLPAPATLALLEGKPTLLEGRGELTTPTGAAILAACASFDLPPAFAAARTGYGVGHRIFEDRPNLLRASLGEAPAAAAGVWLLETHLDDATPQLLGHLIDRLLLAGALDAGLSPLTMKKGRSGQRLTVVCRAANRAALTELIFRESPTLGIRAHPVERDDLERRFETVATAYGPIRIKVALLRGEVVNRAPEYDDCLAAATAHAVPLKLVMAAALKA